MANQRAQEPNYFYLRRIIVAISTCAKCGNRFWELVESAPLNAAFKLMFVQCNKCGSVVGVTEYYSVGEAVHQLAAKLGVPLT